MDCPTNEERMRNMLSIILPAFNEELNIPYACNKISKIMIEEKITFELIFVDDGSKDGTWSSIEQAAQNMNFIHGISFSRNFGKEAALIAGLSIAKGDCCAVMDCDLQHPPQTLIKMYHLWEDGYEIVEGVKTSRGKENIFHNIAARSFYRIISKATGIDMSRASDFKLMDRKVVDCLLAMQEKAIFFRALSSWIGFRKIQVEFAVQERMSGESKWSTKSLIKYAITNITSFCTLPMQMVTGLGILYLFFAIILFMQTIVKYLSGEALEGFSTVIILLLLTGSLIMISLGILGYYITKIYDEVRNRPRYIISKSL